MKEFLESILSIFKSKVNKDESLWGWLLWIWEKDTDYILWSSLYEKIEEIENINRQPIYEYNQGAQYKTRNWCTIYSAITQLSYLFNREFTLCEIYEIGDKMIAEWKLDPDNWAYLSDAIDYTRRWWNEKFPDKKIASYRIDYLDEWLIKKIRSKIRLTQLWYRTSSDLYNELQSKWYASKKDYPKVWWHAVTSYWINIIDNYKWKAKKNRYNFQYEKDLINNWVIFRNWYLFLKI